ncbi:MAG: hypothetical protein CTY13_03470 [Methylobacter sp.]|nr:MAG: hypothetical protein CTY13_03470 [Methylobacter sp.]
MTSLYPDSAISSWGGFVYQGKVALYHAIKLLSDKEFDGAPIAEFELQLDSTDDFAIYVSGSAISIHQVKAKASPYRSTFENALTKSSKINTDCSASTRRYFHIANPINDDSDFTNTAASKVEFYKYGDNKYCLLADIEKITKEKIASYLSKNSLPTSEILIDRKYCNLSELVTKQVVRIHALIHGGQTENKAAYTETITSQNLEEILLTDFNAVVDKEYELQKLRIVFANTFEEYIANNDQSFSEQQIKNFGEVFRFIYSMSDSELAEVMQSLRPSNPDEPIRFDDIQNYAEIVTEISSEIVLAGLPHYVKNIKRYLPTALILSDRKISHFKERLVKHIRLNHHLANILFEYNTLITGAEHNDINIIGSSNKITKSPNYDAQTPNNIVREFPVSIISLNVAQGELDA